MNSNWSVFRRLLGGALIVALVASCGSFPRAPSAASRADVREANHSWAAGSEALTNPQNLVGGRYSNDCAIAIAAASLFMLVGAIAIATTAGASAPVIGLALAGAYGPTAILAC